MLQQGLILIPAMCCAVLAIAVFRRKLEWVVNFLLRGVIGVLAIDWINGFLLRQDLALTVGINPLSILTSGTLGIPGVALLYGVQIYHFL